MTRQGPLAYATSSTHVLDFAGPAGVQERGVQVADRGEAPSIGARRSPSTASSEPFCHTTPSERPEDTTRPSAHSRDVAHLASVTTPLRIRLDHHLVERRGSCAGSGRSRRLGEPSVPAPGHGDLDLPPGSSAAASGMCRSYGPSGFPPARSGGAPTMAFSSSSSTISTSSAGSRLETARANRSRSLVLRRPDRSPSSISCIGRAPLRFRACSADPDSRGSCRQ